MRLRIVSGIMLTLLMTSLLILAFTTQSAKASGAIYIRADGSVEPTTAPISSIDNVIYNLTSSIYDSSIEIERDNIVIDGGGYALLGTGIPSQGKQGLRFNGRSNVTVRNIEITGWAVGIGLYGSSRNTICQNTITGNLVYGIALFYNSSNNVISHNNLAHDSCGIKIFVSTNNSVCQNSVTDNTGPPTGVGLSIEDSASNYVAGNVFTGNHFGIMLYESTNNTLRNNVLEYNIANLHVTGVRLSDFVNQIDTSNTVSGRPVHYMVNQKNKQIPAEAGYVAAVNCEDILVKGQNLSNGGELMFAYTKNSTIEEVNMSGNYIGVYLFYSSGNRIFHSNFINNTANVLSHYSKNAWNAGYPLGGNYWSYHSGLDLYSGTYQSEFGSDGIGDSSYVIDESNEDNYPLIEPYVAFENQTIYIRADGSIDPSGAPVHRIGDLYTLIDNITANDDGIVIERSNITLNGAGHTLRGSGVSGSKGVYSSEEHNATIKNMNIEGFEYGMHFYASLSGPSEGYNSLSNNRIINNTYGVYVICSSMNTLSRNNITNNEYGVFLYSASLNMISENNITSNIWGIRLHDSCRQNTLSKNLVADNGVGVGIYFSSNNNTVWGNNFVDNTNPASLDDQENIWDNGYPTGGNYWSGYSGVDLQSGPFQNESGGDGVGDTPYSIGLENRDEYPLMTLYPSIHAISVDHVESRKTVVGQGLSLRIDITLNNKGHFSETFDLTIFANMVEIATFKVTLTSDPIISFFWNTTDYAKGNYTISTYAHPVQGETRTTDNTFIDGWVMVAMVGDITGLGGWPDGKCDIRDIALVAKYFGQNVPPAPANCDVTGPTTGLPDGKIDIRDIALVAKNFGKIDP